VLQEEWVPVLSATDIAPGDLIPVNSDGLSLLLVADYDGSVYCTAGCRYTEPPVISPPHTSRLAITDGKPPTLHMS
jgi:nitrite reductase/ring-hydroxylating ferredoxin subunit